MTLSPHKCRYWQPTKAGWRGTRWCDWCGRREVKVARPDGVKWEVPMTPRAFGEKWLPAISSTKPKTMMLIQVAFPFEFNSYESWDIVFRVIFQFPSEWMGQRATRVDIMNGWQSKWAQHFNRIDAEAEAYYKARTGRDYDIGDNTMAEMRAFIQAPLPEPKPPDLRRVK